MKACILAKTTLTKNSNKIICLLFISTCVAFLRIFKIKIISIYLEHEFQVMCCSELGLKDSTRDGYTPKCFTHAFDYREKKRGGEPQCL